MSAGLTDSDSMFSVRETPWHGLGAVLEQPPATVAEAIEASGLGWSVAKGADRGRSGRQIGRRVVGAPLRGDPRLLRDGPPRHAGGSRDRGRALPPRTEPRSVR